MFPLAVLDAIQGHWPLVLGNLAVSAVAALGILKHLGQFDRPTAR